MGFSNKKLFLTALIIILVTAAFTIYINYDPNRYQNKIELESAIRQANHVYNLRKSQGIDLKNGPCLSNVLMPGWVVDIVHNPRIAIDNLSQNQCSSYLEGSAKHFVELDLNGNLIRAE